MGMFRRGGRVASLLGLALLAVALLVARMHEVEVPPFKGVKALESTIEVGGKKRDLYLFEATGSLEEVASFYDEAFTKQGFKGGEPKRNDLSVSSSWSHPERKLQVRLDASIRDSGKQTLSVSISVQSNE